MDQEAAEFKEWEMPVNQMGGIYTDYPRSCGRAQLHTVKDYDDWITRLHAIPSAFDQVTQNMAIGMEDQRVPPRYLLEKALEQVKQLANQKPEDSPLALPLKKFPASIPAPEQERIKTEMLDAIGKEVLPAYLRFARFLEVSYIPAGRAQPGIVRLPDGAKYYQFLIRRTTTTDLTAEQIHQIGLDEVAKDEAEMLAIAQKLGFKDLKSFRASLKTNPKLHPASAEALMDAYRGYLGADAGQAAAAVRHACPRRRWRWSTVPDYIAKTCAAGLLRGGHARRQPAGAAVRGHLQRHRAQPLRRGGDRLSRRHSRAPSADLHCAGAQGIPEFRKYDEYTAYTEGWALYAERLGKDVGFYQDPYSDYGRLEADIWRAIRLVVDTGVHSQGWTREQMVQYFHDHSNIDETAIQSEVDRYIAWPGQALAYKIGQLKILELRERARKALGDKFDIRAFHDQVLDAGALPLDVLEQRIDAWIAAQKAGGRSERRHSFRSAPDMIFLAVPNHGGAIARKILLLLPVLHAAREGFMKRYFILVLADTWFRLRLYAQVTDTTVCDVVKNPASFDGKMVRIKGTVVAGFDEFVIKDSADPNCGYPVNGIWLSYPQGAKGKAGPAAMLTMQPARNFAGKVHAADAHAGDAEKR